MKTLCLAAALLLGAVTNTASAALKHTGVASWYGEAHRGKPMANGRKFNPDRLTAASWFYPLGSKVRVALDNPDLAQPQRAVIVTITDRGPAWRLVRRKRIIDLTYTAFKELAEPDLGLVAVKVEREE